VSTPTELVPEPTPVARKRSGRTAVREVVFGSVEGWIGAAIVFVFVLLFIFGPALAPDDPTRVGVGLPDQSPSAEHLLGTDSLGRDTLSRLLAGARSVIVVPLLATLLAFTLGGFAGMAAGYLGGRSDRFFSVGADILLSMPPLLIVLVVITAAGGSAAVVVLSVGIVYSPRVARILRGATQGVARSEYVQAAQARGESTVRIVTREVLPNIGPTVFVEFAVRLAYAIIFVATLNFLGLGAQPPSPNWGLMVSEARQTIVTQPLQTLAPAFAIALLSVGIGLLADAVTKRMTVPGAEEYSR
jgi:peptide/nickel transport system permease protein